MKLNNGIEISNFGKPYYIAELNSSHFGDMDKAKNMISEAKKSGIDCVKFQSWTPDTLYSQTYYEQNPIAKRFVKKFSFSPEELKELSVFSNSIDISFASTPYSKEEVDFLIHECKVPFIKIASMEINNLPYLEYIAKTGSAIILSTGMAEFEEIKKGVETIIASGNRNLCVLHCVSIYPCPPENINLNNILTLRDEFKGIPIGYSDHTIGHEVPIASIAMGSPIIEKHFTLDNSAIGMDNQMATEPESFRNMIDLCNNAYKSLGLHERLVSSEELSQRLNMRRSIVSKNLIKKGQKISGSDIVFKRPGDGISPDEISDVIGKFAKNDIDEDHVIYMDDIE
jgi:sialic acid synthase SpsE